MRRAPYCSVLVAAVIAFAVQRPGLAFAQAVPTSQTSARAQAAQGFKEGSKAFDLGDFAHAADAFEQAYRLAPHIDALWNAARARQRADELPRAATLYARYLREAPPDARDRNVATAELGSLASRLGRIEVHGSGIEQLAVDEHPSEERITYVSPGAHVVRAVVAGALMQQQTPELAAGDVVSLVFEAQAPAIPQPQDAHPAPQPDRPPLEARPPSPPERGGMSPWLVVGGGVLTGVAAAATIASGLSTLSALDAFNARPTASNLATGQSMQARTNVLLGVSIGLGVMTTATAVWLVDWRSTRRRDVRVGLGVTGVQAEWRF
jgi:tetratricopeptide (TPR) repeat protein